MKKIWIILILGIIIRLFLSATTFHPDIQAFHLSGYLLSSGHILDLYDYLPGLEDSNPIKNVAVFNYPPAIYWFNGLFSFFFSNILNFKFLNDFIINLPESYGNILVNLSLLLLKIPYLIPDLLIGFILFKMFKSTQANLVFALWMFNPVNLFATYMMGQFDIIPTFFTVLSLYLISKNNLQYAALALGGGIAFKIFPVFLIIPLILLGKTFFDKIKLLGLTALPYFLSILPFIGSSNFRSEALFANQSSKSLYASLPVSGGESILLFPAFLVLFYLLIWRKINRGTVSLREIDKGSLWRLYLIPLLLFFIFTHYHPQWLIWITPFLIMDLALDRFKNILPILLILGSWLLSLFFFDASLTLGLFAPLFPVLRSSPSIWNLLSLNIDYNFSRSLLQTIFAGACGFLVYYHFHKKNVQ